MHLIQLWIVKESLIVNEAGNYANITYGESQFKPGSGLSKTHTHLYVSTNMLATGQKKRTRKWSSVIKRNS